MTYAQNILKEDIDQDYLGVLTLRRLYAGAWTASGGIFSAPFDYGNISRVSYLQMNSGIPVGTWTELIQVSSQAAVSSGKFFYDRAAELLYVGDNLNISGAITFSIVIFYDLYLATSSLNWYSNPVDPSSDQIYFDGVMVTPPVLDNDMTNDLFGFVPLNVSAMICGDVQNFWVRHLYDSSFNRARLKIYHVAGPLVPSNVSYTLTAYGTGLTVTDEQLSIELAEPQSILDQEFRFSANLYDDPSNSFYPDTVDVGSAQRPLRRIYGYVEGLPLVNLNPTYGDPNSGNPPSTSDNRIWLAGYGGDTYADKVVNFHGTSLFPNGTNWEIGIAPTAFRINESIILNDLTNTRYARVLGPRTAIPITVLGHTTITPMNNNVTGTATALAIRGVTIVQGGTNFYPLAGRDYVVYTDPGPPNVIGIQFTNNFEATLGMNTLQPSDTVVVNMAGSQDLPQIGGVNFGSLDTDTGALTQGVPIIYALLLQAGVPESEIDTTTFQNLQSSIGTSMRVGFATVQRSGDSMPTFRDIILRVLSSYMLRLFVDNNGLWTLRQMGPLSGSPNESFDDLDISRDSFQYKFGYADLISKVNVQYAFKEHDAEAANGVGETWNISSVENPQMKFLHQIVTEKDFETVLLDSSDADVLAKRLSFLFSDRRGFLSIEGKSKLRTSEISDTIQITRKLLPGNSFDDETSFSRSFSVVETSKDLSNVKLTLEDQKGIQDNAGSW